MESPRRRPVLRLASRVLLVVLVLPGAGLWVVARHLAPTAIVEPPRNGVGAEPPAGIRARTLRGESGVGLAAGRPTRIPAVRHAA